MYLTTKQTAPHQTEALPGMVVSIGTDSEAREQGEKEMEEKKMKREEIFAKWEEIVESYNRGLARDCAYELAKSRLEELLRRLPAEHPSWDRPEVLQAGIDFITKNLEKK